ncbi:hypothetical protein C1H46_043368 [Malus baccata]|uniref:Uncharacterized protein n=1 Tax=Malus baccata TaxID=106549 RepID=A0A540KA66_MALBA|nr:hypothetical protein C1H46_043368 [Malus baccata]
MHKLKFRAQKDTPAQPQPTKQSFSSFLLLQQTAHVCDGGQGNTVIYLVVFGLLCLRRFGFISVGVIGASSPTPAPKTTRPLQQQDLLRRPGKTSWNHSRPTLSAHSDPVLELAMAEKLEKLNEVAAIVGNASQHLAT